MHPHTDINKNGVKITHFPVTRSEAPWLKHGEEELSSCKVTKAPKLMEDEAIEATSN